jgi:hypothetical protein
MKMFDHRCLVATFATLAFLASPGCRSGRAEVNPKHGTGGKLVFMLTTGFEDLEEVRLCLQDIKAAKASGHIEDVIWLVRGRGVDSL